MDSEEEDWSGTDTDLDSDTDWDSETDWDTDTDWDTEPLSTIEN